MLHPGILTLTTDFGGDGPYVAAMKGVILSQAPRTQMVDVTHAISPQNVLEGAYVMGAIVATFPEGTVHLGVVDPGVGTDRRLIAASVAGQWFVVPDNGLLSGVTRTQAPEALFEIVNPRLRRRVVSTTFHGRDILAPAAAHLLSGGDPAELGPPAEDFIRLRNFRPTEDAAGVVGEVIFRDTFGNLITNIPADRLTNAPPDAWSVEISGARVQGLTKTYGASPSGALVALVGSTGWLEVAVVNGDAARQLAACPGTTVLVRKAGAPS